VPLPGEKASPSYRERFAAKTAADDYATNTYAPDNYHSLLWDLERHQLDQILCEVVPRSFDYLDFACGTGRVFYHVRPVAATSCGIDVSTEMLEIALGVDPKAKLLCKDITREDDEVEAKYDVITAFRFILNAEPALRHAALTALRRRLRDNGILILNNHANLLSHKAAMAPYHSFRRRFSGATVNRYLTHRGVVGTCARAGLRAHRVAGSGLLGGRIADRIGSDRTRHLETWFAQSNLSRFGSNQIYIATLA
jgi:SAM-dependent methyltransferase